MAAGAHGIFDGLIDKILGGGDLTKEECEQFADALRDVAADDNLTDDQRSAAKLMRATLEARRRRYHAR